MIIIGSIYHFQNYSLFLLTEFFRLLFLKAGWIHLELMSYYQKLGIIWKRFLGYQSLGNSILSLMSIFRIPWVFPVIWPWFCHKNALHFLLLLLHNFATYKMPTNKTVPFQNLLGIYWHGILLTAHSLLQASKNAVIEVSLQ